MENKKHEWYGLAPAQREKLVLELLAQGYTADMLNEYFDVKTKRVINDFMNSRGYRKKDNSYIPKQQSENMSAAPVMQQQNNILPNIQIDEETIVNVLTLSKQADKIQEIIDLYDNSIVSYVVGHSNNNKLVFDTLDIAVANNPTAKPIFHSDRGYQYTSKNFKAKLDKISATQIMSRAGRCIDNGPIEWFWELLNLKCII